MNTSLILTHCEDPDGIISHALLIHALGITKEDPCNHFFARYDRLVSEFEKVEKRLGDIASGHPCSSSPRLYVADIGLNGTLANAGGSPYALLERITSQLGEKGISWIDHHETSLNHREALVRMRTDLQYHAERCAALLVKDIFGLDTEYESELAHIAQAHDHKKPGSTSQRVLRGDELEKVISLANERLDYTLMNDITWSLVQGTFFNSHFELRQKWKEISSEFDSRKSSAYTELESSIAIEEIAGLRVLFAYSPAILSMKPAQEYIRLHYEKHADLFFVGFQSPSRNHFLLKRADVDFPVIQIATDFGGGGRGNGGGFSTPYDVTSERYAELKEKIVEKIVAYSNK